MSRISLFGSIENQADSTGCVAPVGREGRGGPLRNEIIRAFFRSGAQELGELVHHAQMKQRLRIPIQPPGEPWREVVNGSEKNPILVREAELESVPMPSPRTNACSRQQGWLSLNIPARTAV